MLDTNDEIRGWLDYIGGLEIGCTVYDSKFVLVLYNVQYIE